VSETCACGSGLPFGRCHGDPRNDFAREQALREAESIASFFPHVRVTGIDQFVDGIASRACEARFAALEEIVDRIPDHERRRVVRLWSEPYADRWASMTRTAVDVEAAERALVRGAVVAALDERVEPARVLLEPLDGSGMRSPYPALALMLPPPAVWSIDEARAAAAGARGRRSSERIDVVENIAFALMTFEHVSRNARSRRAIRARTSARRFASRFGSSDGGVSRCRGGRRRCSRDDGLPPDRLRRATARNRRGADGMTMGR
jgi:hypothetical protein